MCVVYVYTCVLSLYPSSVLIWITFQFTEHQQQRESYGKVWPISMCHERRWLWILTPKWLSYWSFLLLASLPVAFPYKVRSLLCPCANLVKTWNVNNALKNKIRRMSILIYEANHVLPKIAFFVDTTTALCSYHRALGKFCWIKPPSFIAKTSWRDLQQHLAGLEFEWLAIC